MSQSEQNCKAFMRFLKESHGNTAIVKCQDDTIDGFTGLILKIEPHGDNPIDFGHIHLWVGRITVPREGDVPRRVRDIMANNGPDHTYMIVWIPGKSVDDILSA